MEMCPGCFGVHYVSNMDLQHKLNERYLWVCISSAGWYWNSWDFNTYAVQQDTQSGLMSKFIQHLC